MAGTLLAGAAAAVTAESLRDAFASEPESESEERRPAEAVPDKNGSVEAVSQERVSGGAAEENPQAADMPGGDASEGIEESPIESMQQEDPVRHGSPEQ
ncbi:MAG TPA: hypothetical protein DHV42_05115, partial [Lachnospiraceae bacterium]|nr:hypothetical protein [Lachnospiraceae bacterium]